MTRLLLCLTLGLTFSGCAHPTFQSPTAQKAYTADQVVVRLNELQGAAIDANKAGALDVDTTRVIVQFCVAGNRTLAAVPQGWPATIQAAWRGVKPNIPDVNVPALRAAVLAADIAITLAVSQ